MNCYFRTHISNNSGIGNYMRCLRLALALKKKGHICSIFIDHKITNNILNEKINHIYLYDSKNKKISEVLDAETFNKKTGDPGFVFLDDYRLSKTWQAKIKKKHNKIIVIDDFFNENNNADILINTKPDFLIKSNYEKEISRNKNSKLLLGPKFAIIDKKNKNIKKKNYFFRICFYFGGSGDLKIAIKLIKKLSFKTDFKKIDISVIIGPYSKNKKKFDKFKKNYRNIKIIQSKFNLSEEIKNLDLFIGSAGISIFETALYKVPSIIFTLNDNQKVDNISLEKMGHYFVLKKEDLNETAKISDIIEIFYKKKLRIKKLIMQREFNVDDKGTIRIINEIFSKNMKNLKFEELYEKSQNKLKKNILGFEKIKDIEINNYRNVRNNLLNRKFSLKDTKIKKVDHYRWWFKNNRQSYVFKNENKTIMYFFHDILKIKNYKFLIPGWFVVSKNISFIQIMHGIKYQYEILTQNDKFKNMTQIGIINKKNKSMIDLAPKLNWQLLDNNHAILKILKIKIKIKNSFNYYTR